MPGLSQLKQFNKDLLSIGDEISIRASRGEKPVEVLIPKEVEDKNDSEDFVLGMPEIEAEIDNSPVDEDLSDLAGLANPSSTSSNSSSEPAPTFEAPDLSALLNPMATADDQSSGGMDMPDLSMFEDTPEEVEEEAVEEEPEEVSVADMGLDALLSGAGFDAPEEEEVAEEPESEPLDVNDFEEVEDLDSLDAEPVPEAEEVPAEEITQSAPTSTGDAELDALLGNLDFGSTENKTESKEDDLLPEMEELTEEPGEVEDLSTPENDLTSPVENLDTPVEELSTPADDFSLPEDDFSTPAEDFSNTTDDFSLPEGDFDAPVEDLTAPVDDLSAPADDLTVSADDFAEPVEELTDGVEDFDTPVEDLTAGMEDLAAPAEDLDAPVEDISSPAEDLDTPVEDRTAPAEDLTAGMDDFSLPADDLSGADNLTDAVEDLSTPADDFSLPEDDFSSPAEEASNSTDDFSLPEGDFDAPAEDFSAPADDLTVPADDFADGADDTTTPADDFGAPVEELTAGMEDLTDGAEDFSTDAGSEQTENSGEGSGIPDFNMDDMDFGSPDESAPVDFDADDVIPDYEDSDLSADGESSDENQPIETFDTSEMEGMDFGIPDTDTQLNGGAGDFELGNNDDFAMEGEFEIPGFSDVTTAKEEKSKKTPLASSKETKGKKGKKNLEEPDFNEAEVAEELPPNTLSDVQYKQFLKNLSEYPLNVRLAFEDLIVQDEFTDDAEFEVIEKILNKAPARQVASMLEKMLDTSIPVPRDFEHRTAEEYEAYKKSLSYQLRNKIIPGLIVGVVVLLVGWGIFNFSKNCIYKPLKASKLYKQGYALLQADEYPQAEMRFEEAVKYRINKKWFFNYARGYREHKQYQRAGAMYQRILRYFKHNKAAGLEYADMELNDLANYERAEEIVRREVLDYHINDADGILMLGDIFLEWGTEKDPSKLENAREQYATLLQLYKTSDLYLSRMMRYFIRSDNLRNVIQMQKTFEPREKSLCAEDWAELSGYLLDKYYGPLAPSEEYLRYEIEGLRGLLIRAVKTGPQNPIAHYNLAKYFINSGETGSIEKTLQTAIERFNTVPSMKKRDIYKYIDSYRLLGEHYIDTTDYLQAQEQFAEGISLYTTERDNAGFEGTPEIGKLYEDMGNIKYSISGDYDEALLNYKYSVELENDSSSIRYRIGYIQYKNHNYAEALGSFMKAGDGNVKERNLLLAMANTLSLRGDDYAAQGYYNQLINNLDDEISKRGMVFPQANIKDYDVVNTYLSASNNYGVTLYRLAKRTGNSSLNAQAIVQFQQSLRAWDSMTRNQDTLVRLPGSNLAEQNIQYITHPIPNFEPAIYIDIAKTLLDNENF